MENTPPDFEDKDTAVQWMLDKLDDPCVDNHRFAYADDPTALDKYREQEQNGCCGFFDREITILGRAAHVGCNYGH